MIFNKILFKNKIRASCRAGHAEAQEHANSISTVHTHIDIALFFSLFFPPEEKSNILRQNSEGLL